jgi:beta-glucanase (GH16 family)
MASARYEAHGNTFPAKELFKAYGFHWDKDKKVWYRIDKTYDISGEDTETAVMKVRKAIKNTGLDVDIVFKDATFDPSEPTEDWEDIPF